MKRRTLLTLAAGIPAVLLSGCVIPPDDFGPGPGPKSRPEGPGYRGNPGNPGNPNNRSVNGPNNPGNHYGNQPGSPANRPNNGTPVAEAVARKLSKEPLPEAGIRYCRKVTVAWCFFFIANGGVAMATVLSGNRAAWLLWNGCLSYGAIGLMIGFEYLVRRRVMRHAA